MHIQRLPLGLVRGLGFFLAAVLGLSAQAQTRQQTAPDTAAYSDTLGHGLRIRSRFLHIGEASPGGAPTAATFSVRNTGHAPCGIRPAKPLPAWLKMKLVPATLKPGQQGALKITYNGKTRKDFGFITDPIFLQTTGPKPSLQTTLYVQANVQDKPSPLAASAADKHSHLTISPEVINLGTKQSAKVYTEKVELSNKGAAPITIYGVKSECRCIRTELISYQLAPNQKTELYIHFDAHSFGSTVSKSITVYSTDSAHPAYSITLKANVLPPPGQSSYSAE